ncbi:cutinase family protein [Nocardia sp. NPDC058497]|uniref:cutinase family protein n=1 Tax=Nocardia sp. NPDC058497 TaxID=3346529 RepID=UPI003662D503
MQSGEEGAATTADTSDTGMLGQAFGRITTATGGLVHRSYIVYGTETDSASAGYAAAISAAADRIEQTAVEAIGRCPSVRVAVAGYAQGAAAAASWAEKVGAGRSSVPADTVAGVALVANPARRAATTVLPGTDSATPAPTPGTEGTNTRTITLTNTGLSGAGIAAAASPVSYGTLVGRVADLCVAGDATCDVQSGSPLLTAVANISGQAEGKDPVTAIGVVAEALASTAFTTAVGVVSDDISGNSLDQLSYDPSKTLGQRIAEASSPTAPTTSGSDALSALFKVGAIGLNSVIAVAEKVFTASTITELATVGLSNPAAALATLAAKFAEAVVDLVPPQTISTWVTSAFEAITSTITDTSDLYTTSATAQYSDATGRRASYTSATATSSGTSPLTAVADWFIALAEDLAPTANNSSPATTPSASPSPKTTIPTATSTSPPVHAATTTPRP